MCFSWDEFIVQYIYQTNILTVQIILIIYTISIILKALLHQIFKNLKLLLNRLLLIFIPWKLFLSSREIASSLVSLILVFANFLPVPPRSFRFVVCLLYLHHAPPPPHSPHVYTHISNKILLHSIVPSSFLLEISLGASWPLLR